MKLQHFKKQFFTELSALFPETEIQSFFNLLTKFKLNLTRIEVALQTEFTINKNDLNLSFNFNKLEIITLVFWFGFLANFIFAVFSEEVGLFGSIFLILLFTILIWRIFRLAIKSAN